MKNFFEESKTVSAEVVVKQIPEKEVVVDTKPVKRSLHLNYH